VTFVIVRLLRVRQPIHQKQRQNTSMSRSRREIHKYRASRFGAAGLLIVAGIFLGACTTTTVQSFNVVRNPDIDAVYIAADADFSRYSQLHAKDMGIFFPTNSPLSNDELGRIRQIFRDSFLAELQDYTIVSSPGPQVLAVEASLVDLRQSGSSDIPNLRPQLSNAAQPGELLFLMELQDSETGRVLGRAADSAAAPTFAVSQSDATDWSSVEEAARHWAALFRNFLDQNLGR